MLEKAVGGDALKYLLRLWGHCEDNKRGGTWRKVGPDYVESVCGWAGESGVLFAALKRQPVKGKAGWVVEHRDKVVIHDWDDLNRSLLTSWRNGANGGRKRKSDSEPAATPPDTGGKPTGSPPATRSDQSSGEEKRLDQSGGEKKGGTPARGSMVPPPTLEQVLAHARKVGWPYPEAEIRLAFLEFEAATMPDGSWAWGKRPVTDWRASMEVRLAEAGKKDNAPAPTAVNGRLATIEKQLRELSDDHSPDAVLQRGRLKRERDALIQQQQEATK